MLKRILRRLTIVTILISSFSFLSSFNTGTSEWKFDPSQAKIHFEIPGYYKQGDFGGLSGTFSYDPAFPEQTKIDAKIEVATVNTGIKMLNWHLKTKSYFDAKDFPEIEFHSSSAVKTDTVMYADGKLTMKGITKDVRLEFYLGKEKNITVFYGSLGLFAGDYGVGKKNKNGKDHVGIGIEVPISK